MVVIKKKKWFDILAPELFGNKVVGQTLSSDQSLLVGRTTRIGLTDLVSDISRFFIKLKFKIIRVDGSKCYTKFHALECTHERLYRMVQRRRKKIETIQDTQTKDGTRLRLKTVAVTTRNVNTSIKNRTRAFIREYMDKKVSSESLDGILMKIITAEIQKQIKSKCKKIYPIADIEIRKVEVLDK